MIPNLNPQLKEVSPEWFDYLNYSVDLSKLKVENTSKNLDMLKYCKCVVGKALNKLNGGVNYIYFHKEEYPDTYSPTLIRMSNKISEGYHYMIQHGDTKKFNREVNNFINFYHKELKPKFSTI